MTDNTLVPQHIAIIMDGNGRWAKQRHLPRLAGHKAGVDATRQAVEFCAKNAISALTIFAFSSENWNRPVLEVNGLMSLFISTIKREVKKLNQKNIKVTFIGERKKFAENLQKDIEYSEKLTKNNTGLQLTIAANYGGKWDIVNACKKLLHAVEDKQITLSQIDENCFGNFLTLSNLSAPDLLIRTGGEHRMSNFLLWQLAYAELYFCDVLWPDFSEKNFSQALNWFSNRQRRFGETGQQVENKTN